MELNPQQSGGAGKQQPKAIYKPDARGGKPGAVSLREYLSVGSQHDISGMSISGLGEEAPLMIME